MLDPVPRRSHCVHLPVTSAVSSAFSEERWDRLPALLRKTTSRGPCFEVADIPCSGLQFCSPPRSSLPLRILLQGGRGFYIRAYRASLPPHAPDILTVRTQAIDGTRTFTLPDSQPCRLLTFLRCFSAVGMGLRPTKRDENWFFDRAPASARGCGRRTPNLRRNVIIGHQFVNAD
jgi:hypothetical protein